MKKPNEGLKSAKSLKIIGTSDHIDLPEFGLENLGCKVDTGAATSALHCHKVRLIEKDGNAYVRFQLLDPEHPSYQNRRFTLPLYAEKEIRNSFGQSEWRYAIKTPVVVFGKTYRVVFTLSDRAKMKFPILLGSRFLRNKFMVDVSQKDLSLQLKRQILSK